MNIHENAPLTPKRREAMVRSVVEGELSKAERPTTSTRCRIPLPNALRGSARKVWKGCAIAPPDGHHMYRCRGVAPPAPHRQADRCRSRGVTVHRQPRPSPLGIEIGYAIWSRPSRSAAMSARTQARSFTSTSKSSGVSSVSVIASPAIGLVRTKAVAQSGISFTSALRAKAWELVEYVRLTTDVRSRKANLSSQFNMSPNHC